jgi:LuxR family maltose regulon positive regulatory protein
LAQAQIKVEPLVDETLTANNPGGTSLRDTLLATKLYVPPVRPNLVTRRPLTERLDQGIKGKLTLVSAPAGFGKTTLLSEWCLRSDLPVVWVSLDQGDNEVGRFLTYLVVAVEKLRAGVGESTLDLLHTPKPPPAELVLTSLINEIAATPDDFALVLDDYHAIKARPVHDAVAFLLDHLPPQMHLVIASRTNPPLPLARLLAGGHLTKLSASDLRFTPEEATAFLNEAMGLDLSVKDAATLGERTEGWVAGLQLAALSMRGREDIPGFVAAFAGSNRYVFDYLAEEVLRKQPDNVQGFLLETSVLDRLSGPLCDAVTVRSGGQAILEKLERANLLLVPLDDERRWFRYHHLFSQFLLKELRQTTPELVPDLHRRACDWFEREGLVAEAVSHALAAGDSERAANLVERIARTTLRRGELSTLRRWLEELSEDLVCARPRLCLFYAWYFLAIGRLDSVETYLSKAESVPDAGGGGPRTTAWEGARENTGSEDTGEILGEVTTIRAAVAGLRGESSRAMDLSRRANELLTEGNQFLRCIIAASEGFAHRNRGDVAAASQAFAEVAALSRSVGATYVALLAFKHLTELQMVQGHLQAAADVCRQALELAAERGKRLPASSAAHVGMGKLLREWNELDAATEHLKEGIELGERGGNVEIVLDGHVTLARTRRSLGDWVGAADALETAKRLAQKHDVGDWVARVKAWQARLGAAQNDRWTVALWLEECGLSVEDELSYPREFEHITLARMLIARGEYDEASGLLERLLKETEAAGRGGRVVEILMLKALVLQTRNDKPNAIAVLRRALTLAEPEGYVRTFADEGEPMVSLLKGLVKRRTARPPDAERDVSLEYVSKLLEALEVRAPGAGARTREAASPLADPISERELEVLRLLDSDLSHREIAAKLFVSLDTVKSHTKHLYRKLGVRARHQAVARAKEFGLI